MSKFFVEVVQDRDGKYYANMIVDGKPVTGLPDHVDYNTLLEGIRQQTGVVILKHKDMKFEQFGGKKYAYIDNTQFRKDCRVTGREIRAGWRPNFGPDPNMASKTKPSLDSRIQAAESRASCALSDNSSLGKETSR